MRLTWLAAALAAMLLCAPAQAQIPGGGGGITVGAPISGSCTNSYVIYNNNGVIGCEVGGGGLTIGTTMIAGGSGSTNCLYDNSGVLGEQACGVATSIDAGGATSITNGTPNGLFYDNAGKVGNLATANSGVLVTSAGGVPSISSTLPSGLTIPGYALLAANNVFTRGQTITEGTANESILASTGYSLTGSNAQSLIDLAGTWNTSGTPTALKLNITNTGSNPASKLFDFQVGGISAMSLTQNSLLNITSQHGTTNPSVKFFQGVSDTLASGFEIAAADQISFLGSGGSTTRMYTMQGINLVAQGGGGFGFAPSTDPRTAPDTLLTRGAAGVFQFSNSNSFSANGSVATVLGSVGPVGSHTAVQKWLTIKDDGGNTLYIPAF